MSSCTSPDAIAANVVLNSLKGHLMRKDCCCIRIAPDIEAFRSASLHRNVNPTLPITVWVDSSTTTFQVTDKGLKQSEINEFAQAIPRHCKQTIVHVLLKQGMFEFSDHEKLRRYRQSVRQLLGSIRPDTVFHLNPSGCDDLPGFGTLSGGTFVSYPSFSLTTAAPQMSFQRVVCCPFYSDMPSPRIWKDNDLNRGREVVIHSNGASSYRTEPMSKGRRLIFAESVSQLLSESPERTVTLVDFEYIPREWLPAATGERLRRLTKAEILIKTIRGKALECPDVDFASKAAGVKDMLGRLRFLTLAQYIEEVGDLQVAAELTRYCHNPECGGEASCYHEH